MEGLQELGWGVGRNARIDTRWAACDRPHSQPCCRARRDRSRCNLRDRVRDPWPFLDATSTLPIVFVNVGDPVGGGFVASLARPGGNATRFASYEFGFPMKWLELLKEIAPGVSRAAVLRDARSSALSGQFGAIQGAAPSFGVELRPIDVRDGDELSVQLRIRAWAEDGLIVSVDLGQMRSAI